MKQKHQLRLECFLLQIQINNVSNSTDIPNNRIMTPILTCYMWLVCTSGNVRNVSALSDKLERILHVNLPLLCRAKFSHVINNRSNFIMKQISKYLFFHY